MNFPSSPYQGDAALAHAELTIKEKERQRQIALSYADTSTMSRWRLSRGVVVCTRLLVILLLIVGIVVLYHFIY